MNNSKRYFIFSVIVIVAVTGTYFNQKYSKHSEPINVSNNDPDGSSNSEIKNTATNNIIPSQSPLDNNNIEKDNKINEIKKMVDIFKDSKQEDSRRVDAFGKTRDELQKYLEIPASKEDNLNWSGINLETFKETSGGRFIQLISEPFMGRSGYSLLFQYEQNNKMICDILWQDTSLVYLEHVLLKDKLLISGRRTSFANAVFIGQWTNKSARWQPENINILPETGGLFSVPDLNKHLVFDNSSKTAISINLRNSDVDILNEKNEIIMRWLYNSDKRGFEKK